MTRFWQTIALAGLWSVSCCIPAYFATRALFTGRIYDGGETSGEWISRAENPTRFWGKVAFYYAMSLLGLVPWILFLVVGIKE